MYFLLHVRADIPGTIHISLYIKMHALTMQYYCNDAKWYQVQLILIKPALNIYAFCF